MDRDYQSNSLDELRAVIIEEVLTLGESEGWPNDPPAPLVSSLEEEGVAMAAPGSWGRAHLVDIPAAEDMSYALAEELSKSYFKLGNKKLGIDTVIFNITSGTDCPAVSQCDVLKHCYARADERFRPGCLARRRRQTKFWDSVTPKQFVRAFPVPRYFRFSESGDFRDQTDVDKMAEIAVLLKREHGVVTYGYTRRSDLDLSELMANAVVNGHGFDASNRTEIVVKDSDVQVDVVCPGNCRTCDFCKVADNLTIGFELRRR